MSGNASGLGHNASPPLDVEQWVDFRHALQVAIRDNELLSPRARLLGIVFSTFMTYEGRDAYPSVRKLAQITGFGVNTIAGLLGQVRDIGLLHMRNVKGRRGWTYETSQTREDAITTYVRGVRCRDTIRARSVTATSDTSSLVSLPESDTSDAALVVSLPAPVVSLQAPVVSLSGSDRRIEDRKKKRSEAGSHVEPVTSWNTAFSDPHDNDGVTITANGEIVLSNGTGLKWLSEFDGDEKALRLALTQASASIQPNSRQPVKLQVERVLARIAGDRHDRDVRYARAAGAKSGKTGNPSFAKVSDEYDRIAQEYGVTLPEKSD